MPRYRSALRRSEEEKRNLKVDLRRIPEWEAELESIRSHFRRFSLSQIVSAESLILEMRIKLDLVGYSVYREREQQAFEQWKNTLTVDNLIRMSKDYSVPRYLQDGTKENMVEIIRSTLKQWAAAGFKDIKLGV